MKKILLFGLPVIVLIAGLWYHAANADLAGSSDAVGEGSGVAVVTVNGEELSEAQFGAAVGALDGYQRAAVNSEPGRRAVADQLVEQRLLAQEAQRRGLDRKAGVVGLISMARDQILAQAALAEISEDETAIDEDELIRHLSHEGEIALISQIVVEGPAGGAPDEEIALERALEARRKLDAGAEFAEVVEEYSVATAQSGELGEVTRNLLLPEIAEAIFATPAGGYTEPLKIGRSYHIFRVAERRTPDEEELRKQIAANPRAARARAAMSRLREEAEVELNEAWMRNPGQ